MASVLVATAAIFLKPVQERNEALYKQQIILDVAGLMEPGGDIDTLFGSIDTRTVDLASGTYTSDADMEATVSIPSELDLAGISQRPEFVDVYLVTENGRIDQVILPVYGKGLWSTMLGYLAVAPDGNTIKGLRFYAHGETPGLGDQMDKESWRAQVADKEIYGDGDEPVIRVIKGLVQEGTAGSEHMLDGMAGATLTGNGITGLVQYRGMFGHRMNTRVGKDISVEEIDKEYDAVLWALGCKSGRKLPVPNSDAPNCVSGVAFLEAFACDAPGCAIVDLQLHGIDGLELRAAHGIPRVFKSSAKRERARKRSGRMLSLFKPRISAISAC